MFENIHLTYNTKQTLIFDVNGDPSPGDVVEFHVYEDEFMRDKSVQKLMQTNLFLINFNIRLF